MRVSQLQTSQALSSKPAAAALVRHKVLLNRL
jgi:hypothetical protein